MLVGGQGGGDPCRGGTDAGSGPEPWRSFGCLGVLQESRWETGVPLPLDSLLDSSLRRPRPLRTLLRASTTGQEQV